jgi:hypothetical protein
MSRTPTFLFVVVGLFVAGCTHPEKAPDGKVVSAPVPEGEGKPMAPVAVSGEVSLSAAHLVLRFEAACEKCVATVHGLDGLAVQQRGAGIGEGPFKAGESGHVDVDLQGTGTLVVRVHGSFGGAVKDRVVTFTVGEPKLEQTGTKVVPTEGPGFKVLPSGQ